MQPWRQWSPAGVGSCRFAGGAPEGLAMIPSVRPTSGREASAWIKGALADYYSPRPQELKYRSPSAASLRQMDDRFSFLRPDTVVVDLGCFSGGWSQVAVERTYASSSTSRVIGVDLVQMDPIENHTFIQGDVADKQTLQKVLAELGDRRADVVLSDLSPPRVGLKMEDHLGSMQCCLYAAKIMERTLCLGGWFIAKLLMGAEQSNWRTYLDSRFETVRSIRPAGSRRNHGEFYMVCRGFNGRMRIAEEVPRPSEDLLKNEGVDQWDVVNPQVKRKES